MASHRQNTILSIAVLLLTVACFPANGLQEETPLPFGLLLSVPGERPPGTPTVPTLQPEAIAALEAAQQEIATLQTARGPYDPALAPLLTAAAERARSMGRVELAVELYAWALHNVRVNEGLASDNQLPLVESLLDLHFAVGDAEAINDRQAYLHRLQGSSRPPWDDMKLRAALRYLRWRQQWAVIGEWERQERFAANLYNDGVAIAESVCADPEYAAEWCAPITIQALGTLYLIDYHVEPLVSEDYYPRTPNYVDWDRTVADERLLTIERSAHGRGRRLLDAALEVVPDNPELLLAAADWGWFQDRRGGARKIYRRLVTEEGIELDTPVPLPQQPLLSRDPRLAEEGDRVRVAMTITANGRAREVTFPDDTEEALRIRTRKSIRETRFRPAFDANGEAIDARVEFDWVSLR